MRETSNEGECVGYCPGFKGARGHGIGNDGDDSTELESKLQHHAGRYLRLSYK